MTDRRSLLEACIKHRRAALASVTPLERARHWGRYFTARRTLRAMPTRRREVEIAIERLLADANGRAL